MYHELEIGLRCFCIQKICLSTKTWQVIRSIWCECEMQSELHNLLQGDNMVSDLCQHFAGNIDDRFMKNWITRWTVGLTSTRHSHLIGLNSSECKKSCPMLQQQVDVLIFQAESRAQTQPDTVSGSIRLDSSVISWASHRTVGASTYSATSMYWGRNHCGPLWEKCMVAANVLWIEPRVLKRKIVLVLLALENLTC